jgi:pimeloyl-ACP methyl ester carboxylesterase
MIADVGGRAVYAYTASRAFDATRPTLVFVHGAANDHSVWTLQSRYFAHHGFNVFAVDLPGHGRSAGLPLGSVEALGEWLIAFLDALGTARAALVGHSLGSLSALEASARTPSRVSHLVLLGPAVPMPVSDDLLAAAKADDHLAIELINGWSFSPGKLLGGNRLPGVWMAGNAMRLMERTPPGVLYADLAACHAYTAGLDAARRVRCASLLILGARDVMAPPRAAVELAGVLAGATTVTLPDCGHAMMAEQPDAVLDALAAFLRPASI